MATQSPAGNQPGPVGGNRAAREATRQNQAEAHDRQQKNMQSVRDQQQAATPDEPAPAEDPETEPSGE